MHAPRTARFTAAFMHAVLKCTTYLGSLAANVIVLQTSFICRSTDIDFNAHWLAFTNDRHAVMMIQLFWFALVHIAEYYSIFMQA